MLSTLHKRLVLNIKQIKKEIIMNLKLIGNTIFINFIKTIDNNVKSYKDTHIKRNKNEVLVFIEPENTQKKEDYHSVDKVFRFIDDSCFFEFGCINLDFSEHWQKYFNNMHGLEF